MLRRLRPVWFISFVLVICFFSRAAAAVGMGNRITADLGFGGYTVPGCWMPLRIGLEKPLPGGSVEVIRRDAAGKMLASESFPASGSTIECPVPMTETVASLQIRLISDHQIINTLSVDPDRKQFPGHLFLVLNLPLKSQYTLENALQPDEPILTVPVGIREFPDTVLSYDGVSAVVMTDPGPVFTPAQVKAFYAWLSGGGKAVVCGARSGAAGFASSLKIAVPQSSRSIIRFSIGFGSLLLFPTDPGGEAVEKSTALSAVQWRNLLNLKLYRQSARLTLQRCFPKSAQVPVRFPDCNGFLLAVVGFWSLAAVFLIYRSGRPLLFVTLLTLVMSLVAVFGASWAAEKWQRGYLAQCHILFLPRGGGSLLTEDWYVKENTLWEMRHAPWGITIRAADGGSRQIKPDLTIRNRHMKMNPDITIQATSTDTAGTLEWLPAAAIIASQQRSGLKLPDVFLYHSDGRVEQIIFSRPEKWRRICRGRLAATDLETASRVAATKIPAWLQLEKDWLKCLSLASPLGTRWLVGRELRSNRGFEFSQPLPGDLIWASPVLN